jgi:hypothetical protein
LPDDQLTAVAGPGAYDLATLIPSVAERLTSLDLSPDAPPLEAPDQRGARVQESLLGVLERLAGNGTVCLVLEDLEYADPGTRDFVSALLRFSRKMPLALIVSYHPDELHRSHPAWRFVRSLQESRSVEHVVVPLMSRDEMVSLVESLRGDRPSLGFMAAVMEGSRGNPLTASQLVAAHDELEGMRLSDPMEEMLHARLAKLPPAAVRVLRVLAAARRPLSDELVLRLELADGHLSKAAIGAALESHLAHRTGDGIEIIHQLCAEAIDMLVLPAERQMIHAGLATLLADRPAEAAWHWDAATRPREARQAHLAAAADAERVEPGQTRVARGGAGSSRAARGGSCSGRGRRCIPARRGTDGASNRAARWRPCRTTDRRPSRARSGWSRGGCHVRAAGALPARRRRCRRRAASTRDGHPADPG